MHVSALVASATIAAAAVIRNDPYVGNFRSFGAAGCHDQNLGVWTVTQSGVTGACNDFRGNTVVSLENTRIVDGYTLYLFTDDRCEAGRTAVAQKACKSAEGKWTRWRIEKDA